MMAEDQPTQPTTRSEFNARLISVTIENEKFQERMVDAEQTCQQYELKMNAQHGLLIDLMGAFDVLVNSPPSGPTNIPEEMCILLTKYALRVSDLSEEAHSRMLQQQNQFPTLIRNDDDVNDHNHSDVGFVDIPLCGNEKGMSSSSTASTSSLSSLLTSSISESDQKAARLEEEIVRVNAKCTSLERTLKTLKRKNTLRDVRNMKSLRNMKSRIELLEEERIRRLDLQSTAEQRAYTLEIELHELQQKMVRMKQQQSSSQSFNGQPSLIEIDEDITDSDSDEQTETESESEALTEADFMAIGVDHCREAVILRNQMEREQQDWLPPHLVAVSEDSETSDDCSEHECSPRSSPILML